MLVQPPAWRPPSHGTLPSLERMRQEGASFPYGCRWCARTLSYDAVEHCEELGGAVHADCHSERCMNPACAYLTCTEERCDDREECGNCGAAICEQHRGDQITVHEGGEVFHDYICI